MTEKISYNTTQNVGSIKKLPRLAEKNNAGNENYSTVFLFKSAVLFI